MKEFNHLKAIMSVLESYFFAANSIAQNYMGIDAQVFIEPGQTMENTELWVSTMNKNGMDICRIRMFESYMKYKEGSRDFTLYDRAFRFVENIT